MRYAVFFKVLYFCQWTLLNTEASPVNYICRTQVQTDVSVDTKHQTLQGVAFPISRDAFQALEKLSKKQLNYVQLEIDIKNETITLANTENTELRDLPKRIPKDSARYHFFLYKHSHEGDYLESVGM